MILRIGERNVAGGLRNKENYIKRGPVVRHLEVEQKLRLNTLTKIARDGQRDRTREKVKRFIEKHTVMLFWSEENHVATTVGKIKLQLNFL